MGIEIRVPLILEGTWKNVKALSESLVRNIESASKSVSGSGGGNELLKTLDTGFNRLIGKIGVLAAIWGAFDVFLRPIMSMFKLIMVLLLMPMMPLLKQMLQNMKEVADKVRKAQEAAGGTGIAAFTAGIGAMMSEPTMWMAIGGIMAAGFVLSLGAKSIIGTLLAVLTLSILWDKIIGDNSEDSLFEKLKTSLGIGLGAAVAALAFGAGTKSWKIGVLALGVGLSIDFFSEAFKESNLWKAIAEAFVGTAISAGVILGILKMFGVATSAAAPIVVPLGFMAFSVIAGILFGKGAVSKYTPEELAKMDEEAKKAGESASFLEKAWAATTLAISLGIAELTAGPLALLGTLIGSNAPGSYPLVYSLILVENEWRAMAATSKTEINGIIKNLDRIPRKIVTIHEIRTVKK